MLALWETFRSPVAVLDASPKDLSAAGLTAAEQARLQSAAAADYSQALESLHELKAALVTLAEFCYPANLRNLPDPPPVLFVRGSLAERDARAVAVVGTRNASPYGRAVARSLGRDLARNGITVISGLARGIDSEAHQGALEAGGRTIGVLACGADVPYPSDAQPLIRSIIANDAGAIITEFAPGTPARKQNFWQRNRIISGLALGVVVVEAPERSGALITANWAAEQNREVFAVPGSVNSVHSRGCHQLLKEGAKLVASVEDILEELNLPAVAACEPPPQPQLSAHEDDILALLSLEQRNVEELIEKTSLNSAQVASTLMLLELKGLVRRLPGNYFVRVK